MTTKINADSVTGGAVVTADASGVLELQSAGTTALTLTGANVTVAGAITSTGGFASPLALTGNSTAGAEIRLPEDTDNGSNYVAIKAANNIASNVTFTLPSADGTNGQVLQTNGSGVLSFQDVSAGNIQLTASGSITAGTAVIVSGNNTGQAVTNFDAAFGAENTFLAANSTTSKVFFNNNTAFVVYKNDSGNGLFARAGTISGATITWGTQFNCSMTCAGQTLSAQYIGNNQYVVSSVDFGNTLQLQILTISGTTITGGSVNTTVTTANYNTTPALCVNTTQQYIVVMMARTDSTLDGRWYAWSGTNISYQGNTHLNIVADQITGITQTAVTNSNRYVFAARRNSSQFDVYALYISSGILYWSGSSTTVATGTGAIWIGLGYNPTADRVFAFYAFNGSGGPRTVAVREITGTFTTATVGSATTLNTFSQDLATWQYAIAYSAYTDRFIIAYEYGSAPLGVRFANATLVGTTWTFNEFVTGSTTQRYAYGGVGFDMIPNTPYFLASSWNSTGGTNAGFVSRITQPYTNVDKWVGIAQTTVSDGQSFKATVSGGVNAAVSGLTAGTRYYLTNAGALTTTITSYPAGIATSTTSILVTR